MDDVDLKISTIRRVQESMEHGKVYTLFQISRRCGIGYARLLKIKDFLLKKSFLIGISPRTLSRKKKQVHVYYMRGRPL